MVTKVCTKCKKEFPKNNNYFYQQDGYFKGPCKSCKKKLYGWSSKTEEEKKKHSQYTSKHSKTKGYKYQKKYCKNNLIKRKKTANNYAKNQIENLGNNYVRQKIQRLLNVSYNLTDFYQVIESKRTQLKLHRECKNQNLNL